VNMNNKTVQLQIFPKELSGLPVGKVSRHCH